MTVEVYVGAGTSANAALETPMNSGAKSSMMKDTCYVWLLPNSFHVWKRDDFTAIQDFLRMLFSFVKFEMWREIPLVYELSWVYFCTHLTSWGML